MSLRAQNTTERAPMKFNRAASIVARQDRIPIWSLSSLFIGIIGMGFLFTFYDIGDINVSFVQTCTQIIPGCLPQTAGNYLGAPVLLNLVGYMLGAIVFGPLADRYGRRDLLAITMLITSLGSLYTALAGNYVNFVLARTITGIGVGADLALVNTYINEVAPRNSRAKYTSLIFIIGSIGSCLGILLGLLLTTPAAPFPYGLPIALASAHFLNGWRILYGMGTLMSIAGLLLRFQLPESPRWLIAQGRLTEAERIVEGMEQRALAHIPVLPPVETVLPIQSTRRGGRRGGYLEIFNNSLYFKRTIVFTVIWLMGYITVYSLVAGTTTILAALGYELTQAAMISSMGVIGSLLCTFIAYFWGERLERKYWLLISALIVLAGGCVFAWSGDHNLVIAFVGSNLCSLGAYLWLPVFYTWTTENYPTRARASGFALVDGLGHVGGGIGFSHVVQLVSLLGPFFTFLTFGLFLLVGAFIALFGTPTRKKRLDEVSP